ncbi:MAG: pyridoxamine 5'-phosphate oxidase family protein [Natrialbaceae archaeon]|nr:pyridoxamine 5'-phosphate oxidase family protein [Natrialbaceae archaeon]
MTTDDERRIAFVCPSCDESMEVNESMKEALLERGCVICGTDLTSAAFLRSAHASRLTEPASDSYMVIGWNTGTRSMPLEDETTLSAADTDAVLSRNETGVLSLARADEPYSIPISYGYDGTERRFFLRLVSTPESEKRQFLSSAPTARLVVYEEEPPVYHSVLTSGTLEEIPRDDLTVEHIEQYGAAKRPLFEIWGAFRQDLDVQLYQLAPGRD